jgi:hypothetical protein
MPGGHVYPDAPYRDANLGADLKQPETDGGTLCLRAISVPFNPSRRKASSKQYAMEEKYSRN